MEDQSRSLVPSAENNPAQTDYQAELKEAFCQAEPTIRKQAQNYRGGIQYNVLAPRAQVHDEEEYKEAMKEAVPDIGIDIFGGDFDVFVRQELGFLNITDLETDQPTIDFHSTTGGHDFAVKIGQEVTVEGTSLEMAAKALKQLLASAPNRGRDDQRTVHLGNAKNPLFFNRDGTPKP